MKHSCGFIIISNKKVLIGHPTGHSMDLWSIPKGLRDADESEVNAALRETKEETGLDILSIPGDYYFLDTYVYPNNKKKITIFSFEPKEDLTKMELTCPSLIEQGELKGQPEIDIWKWVDLQTACELLHICQAKAIREFYD